MAFGGEGPAASVISDDPDTIRLGAALFHRYCAPCHGARAAGENPANPNGGAKPGGGFFAPALDGSAHSWHHPPEYLFNTIRGGSQVKGSRMAGWAGRMGDYEILAVIAFFQSLWPERIRAGFLERERHRVW